MEKCPPQYLSVVAIEKWAFGPPLTKVANITYSWFEFKFFFLPDLLPKGKEPSLFYYLPIVGKRTDGFILSQGKVKHKQLCPGFELKSPVSFPKMIIIMLTVLICIWQEYLIPYNCVQTNDHEKCAVLSNI